MSIKNYFTSDNRKRSASTSSPSPSTDVYGVTSYKPGPSCSKEQKSSNTAIIQQLNKIQPISTSLASYPGTRFGQETSDRHFQSVWFEGRPWLEYIPELDACVCFPCRIHSRKSDSPFVKTGFRNWKHAGTGTMPKDGNRNKNLKGFLKHAVSQSHVEAMKIWEEHKKRSTNSLSVDTMVLTRIPEHRTWLETVFTVVKYLSVNGLPFRGDIENADFNSDEFGGGLYLNTFSDLVFKLDDKLKQIATRLPANAKYTSSDIQNEVIRVLQTILKVKVAEKVKTAETYTVMMDGSSDKRWREIEGVVVRFVNENDKIEEHAIGVEEAHDRSASGLMCILTKCLEDLSIPLDGIASQCYDGASVMSGHRGGLQKLLSDKCQRCILYIHCFCHKLHLVVIGMIETIDIINEHFSLVKSLYDCFKLADVKNKYDGLKLKRLLDTRWTGHRDCVQAINREIDEIIKCLTLVSSSKDVKSEHKVVARGLLSQISKSSFILLNKFLVEFLDIINIANQACQSKSSNLATCLNLIKECRTQITGLTDMYTLHKIIQDMTILDEKYVWERRPVREKTQQSRRLDNFLVNSPIPSVSASDDIAEELRRVIVELSDCFHSEMDVKFTSANTTLWSAMGALTPNHPAFCDPAFLKPFFEYMLTVPVIQLQLSDLHADDFNAFESECNVFKHLILRKFRSNNDIGEIYSFLNQNYSEAAPILSALYNLCITCGYASARVECLFSALAYVDSPRRRTSSSARESALTHLLFERDMVREITFEEFSKEWLKKPRSLFF